MKKNIDINMRLLLCIVLVVYFSSCNKKLPEATPIVYGPANNSTVSIGAAISNDTSYSFFKAAAAKVGVLASLSDTTKIFTVFLPNNDAFRVSGIPSVDIINALPATTVGAIVQYHIIPGEQFLSTSVSKSFPNEQLPTLVTIGQLPGTTVPLQLSTFPSVNAIGFYDNNIPVVAPDQKFSNGVIHLVAAIINPPSLVLKDAIDTNSHLNYFRAAIARADSGQTGLNRFDSLLNYPVTNMTVLAPNDAAFQTLLFGQIFVAILAEGADSATAYTQAAELSSTPDVLSNPSFFSVLTAATIRGIIAYHFLATLDSASNSFEPNIRVFSVNFPTTPSFVTTLINASYATHPGILVSPTFTGPFVSKLTFTGLGTVPPGGAPYSGTAANAVSLDNHAVNGVYYVIDEVLLPQ